VTSRYESMVDRAIREAQERGEFDDLPGAGKPLRDKGQPYDENWWLREFVRREQVTGVLPGTMALRRELDELADAAARMPTEAAVRDLVTDVNRRIVLAQRGHLDGPPVALPTVDVDRVVAAWRARRGAKG
jgi:DnaJ-like protein